MIPVADKLGQVIRLVASLSLFALIRPKGESENGRKYENNASQITIILQKC